MKCPRCEAEAEGRFCGQCGSALEPRACPACDRPVSPGNRFCPECGQALVASATAPAAAPAAAPEEDTGVPPSRWWIAGAAVLGGIVFLAVPYVYTGWTEGGGGERVPMGAQAPQGALPAPGAAPNVDLSSMTPREAADRLYNRVMTALGEEDQGEIDAFLPMAIDAYRLVPDLDADGHFHLSLLLQAQGDYRAALITAEEVLATEPDHLLNLYAAGEAARELGESERAAEHFRHLLDVFDAESARDLPEYREHENMLPMAREAAESFVGGGGP
jgi:hypothetical protein